MSSKASYQDTLATKREARVEPSTAQQIAEFFKKLSFHCDLSQHSRQQSLGQESLGVVDVRRLLDHVVSVLLTA